MAAVVVVLDLSLSMPMNGLFWAAKERACEVIDALDSRVGPDHLHALVTFGTGAALLPSSQMEELEWNHDYGSNLEAALRVSERSLDGAPARLLLLSDLFADAHTGGDGQVMFSCPPAQETLARTVEAIRDCGAARVTIEAVRYRSPVCQHEVRRGPMARSQHDRRRHPPSRWHRRGLSHRRRGRPRRCT